MSLKPVKVGVMGYAHYMRTNFVLHLRESKAVEIVGIYNRSEERRKAAEDDGFFATSSVDEFFKIPGMEAVIVGSANSTHKEFSVMAMRHGFHVFCEKPMALTVEEADEMVREAKKFGVVTHVNHGSPYTDAFRLFKMKVDDYAGRIFHVTKHSSRKFGLWSQGARHQNVAHPEVSGGWTYHHLCHALDEVCILLGTARATKVYHIMQKSCAECPSEEIMYSLLTFDNGATAVVSDNLSLGGYHDTFVQGSTGDIRMNGNLVTVTVPGPSDSYHRPGNLTPFTKEFQVPQADKMIDTVAHKFTQAVRGGKNELLSFEFVANQYRILGAMVESARTGKVIEPKY